MRPDRLEDVFAELIELKDSDERVSFLDEVCGADSGLRTELLELMRAHELAGDFMDEDVPETDDHGAAEQWDELKNTTIGRYTLIARLGSGGFGVVYRALQVEPVRREVALKVIKPGMDTREVIARFDVERQALAMMDHPAIARVLDAGSTNKGHPYFVMELFEGEPITSYCDKHRLEITQRLILFTEVCEAVQHAHQKGIIHRDLKPSNILVAESSGGPIVKVIDFGIAKALRVSLAPETTVTKEGQQLGTPRYMSPEQFRESTNVDTRSDVYSLGVILYELLTGTTPLHRGQFRDCSLEQLQRAIVDPDSEIPSQRVRNFNDDSAKIAHARRLDPRRLAGLIKGDLDWLVMKALEKVPERRYPSANAMANDIRHYLKHEPIDAGPPTRIYQLSKFARRNLAALVMTGLVAISLLSGALLATWNSWRATRAEQLAERRLRAVEQARQDIQAAFTLAEAAELEQRRLRRQAEERERQSRQLVYASDVRLAGQAYREGDIRTFADLLERQIPDPNREDFRGFEWWLLQSQTTLEPVEITQGQSGCCLARFSPDGRFLVTGHYDGKLHVWDADTFNPVRTLAGHQSFANGVDFHPDGNRLASAGDDHHIRIWDLDSGEEIDRAVADQGHVHRVFFGDRGQKLVSAGEAPEVKIWDDSPLKIVERYDGFETVDHHGVKKRLALSPDRRHFVAADQYQTARVYDLTTGKVVCSLDLTGGQFIRCLGYSPDGKWIAGGRYTQEVTLWDAATGEVVERFRGHLDDVQDVAFHPGGHLLATSDKSGIVRTWPLTFAPAKNQRAPKSNDHGNHPDWPRFFVAHEDRIFSIDFSTNGETMVTACRDGTVRGWKAQKMPRLSTGKTSLEPQATWINDRLVAVSDDTRLLFWNTADTSQMSSQECPVPIQSLSVSLDRNRTATGHFDGTVRIWDNATGELEQTLAGHEGTIHSLTFSPWDNTLLTAGDDGLLLQWGLDQGRSNLLKKFPDRCLAVAASPHGPWLAAAVQNEIYLLRLDHASPPRRLRGHLNTADCLAFSPDGKWLASGSDDRTVRLWEVESGSERHVFHAHRSKVESIAFSPDGRTIVSGDRTAIIALSHVETGCLLFSLDLLQYWNDQDVWRKNPWISDLKFSHDGTRLIAGLFRIGYLVFAGPPSSSNAGISERQSMTSPGQSVKPL
ncbi:hypothetical protein CKO51_20405 [Rhodopirellula sp. SM50]|nr:protein kinase [Rhodopirellula sp. SM50]PAY17592.1 hypothetical protein CKO51_20405 [Rhodopirellula sp. SM50]